ncbi:MAG: hypothetical protein ACRD3G_18110 [Vicinamibacterales bacterium]
MNIASTDVALTFGRQTRAFAEDRIFRSLVGTEARDVYTAATSSGLSTATLRYALSFA